MNCLEQQADKNKYWSVLPGIRYKLPRKNKWGSLIFKKIQAEWNLHSHNYLYQINYFSEHP